MSGAKLERRLEALEVRSVPDYGPSPWGLVMDEMSELGMEELGYVFDCENPARVQHIVYGRPPGYVGEWISSGPEAARNYRLWLREAMPCLRHPDTRPPRQVDGWPSYDRPKGELDGKVFDVLLADAPNPETFERWLKLLEIQ